MEEQLKTAAALEWFEKNERVVAAEITEDGQNVFFVTTDSVGTLFQTEPDNEWAKNYYAGIDEGETENLEEWSPLAILFRQGGKLYLCCKGEGKSDYGMALYECNPDGTQMRKLAEISATAGHIPQRGGFRISFRESQMFCSWKA